MRKRGTKLNNLRILFKKRSQPRKKNIRHVFGPVALVPAQAYRIEGVYIQKIRLKLKKNIKKAKKQQRPKKARFALWARYVPNTALTKKSKNARMGSGKGKLVRKAFTLPAHTTLFEFKYYKSAWCSQIRKYTLWKWHVRLKTHATTQKPTSRVFGLYH